MKTIVQFDVNEKRVRLETEAERSLLEVLREDLGLTASKYGCGEGQCGACTVLLDGRAVRSCVTRAGNVSGKRITTLEGFATHPALHPVQQAFIEVTAMQCGYCTSGMIMSAVALLNTNPSPGDQEITRAMQGNVCRCCTYPRIVTAVRTAAKAVRASVKGGAK